MRRGAYILSVIVILGMAMLVGAQTRTLPFSVIRVNGEKNVASPATWVIHNEEEWQKFLADTLGFAGAPPRIDFTRNTVVAIFAGEKFTGGYSVRVERVTDDSSPGGPARGTVYYRIVAPPPDAVTTQALTYPHIIVRIEKRLDQVHFQPPL